MTPPAMTTGLTSLVLGILLLTVTPSAPALEPVEARDPPPLALDDLAGRRHDLGDYAGKVVLVNFWGTWCPPCLKEMPSMQRLKQAMADRPFRILAVNVRQQAADAERFAKALGVDFTILLDAWGQAAREWKVKVYPTSYLIDPEGRIRYRAVGELAWDEEPVPGIVESLLAEDGPPALRETRAPDAP